MIVEHGGPTEGRLSRVPNVNDSDDDPLIVDRRSPAVREVLAQVAQATLFGVEEERMLDTVDVGRPDDLRPVVDREGITVLATPKNPQVGHRPIPENESVQ